MDPLSITAGAIGITNFAVTSITQLHNLIDGLSEVEEVLSDVTSSLANIERPLAALRDLSISDEATSIAAKEDLKKAGIAEAVNKCGDACNKFSDNVSKWTKHSSGGKLSFRDLLSVGVWRREKIRTFRTQLQSCEATVQFAVTSTQLMVQLRSEMISEADREIIKERLQALEEKIEEYLDLTKKQQGEAQERRRELQASLEGEEDGDAQRILAIKEVEEQSRQFEADQVICGVVFSQIRFRRSDQDISNVLTSDDSKTLVGLPQSVVGRINQRIRGVRTERGSAAIVGVYEEARFY